MKRALTIVAAFLLLLFTIPQPTPQPADQTATPPVQQATAVDDIPRHTSISRATRPVHQTVVIHAGDTYGRLAIAHCGTFNAWPGLQTANRWPERRIPIGATAVIACAATTPPPAAKPAPAPATKPATTSAAWVHPLASGKQGNQPNCFRSAKRPGHNGVDMAQPSGTPIRAVATGVIHRKAYQSGGAGHYVVIKHANGIYTAYMHLRAPSPLAVKASVHTGQTIGYVGSTGNSTGNHLHFEVHRDTYGHHTNPAPFMRQRGINIGC